MLDHLMCFCIIIEEKGKYKGMAISLCMGKRRMKRSPAINSHMER